MWLYLGGTTMDCCQCKGIETVFGEGEARGELKSYHKKGPAKTTRILIDALKEQGIEGMTLLDIGGGVGAIQYELLHDGVERARAVDASSAYIGVAREEAERQGLSDRVEYQHGNFVDMAPGIAPADIVTLDRVICCYHDVESLVGLSAEKAGRLYGLVYPRDTWWTRLAAWAGNVWLWVARNPFRAFVHPTRTVEALVHERGLTRRFHRLSGPWQVAVYAREG
jgi:magnesium-protoporphyrin O-methyltransferase